MIAAILLHAAAALALLTGLAVLAGAWLTAWIAVPLWLVGATAILALAWFARGALGPHGGG
ncbi:MAG: hypothetical protein SNJ73_08180 [Acetobacteraceae bacterium]